MTNDADEVYDTEPVFARKPLSDDNNGAYLDQVLLRSTNILRVELLGYLKARDLII